MKLSKKMLLGLVVLVCFVVVVSGCTSSNNTTSTNTSNSNMTGSNTSSSNTSSSNTSSSNTSSSNTSSSNTSSSNDVNVVVKYPGSWAVDVSGTFGFRSLSGTGDQTTSIGNVTGVLTAAARKTEGGNDVLIVSITKGGKTLASQSTSAPWGGATAVATGI